MELKEYFKRIGFSGVARPEYGTLEALMRCQRMSIPFENLDIFDFHRPIRLEPDAVFEKLVRARRGGYCFELNGLFHEALRAIGFSCEPAAVRVVYRKSCRPPLAHRAELVELDGETFYCDVGFGGPGPGFPLRLKEPGWQGTGEERFMLRPAEGGTETAIIRFSSGAAEPVLSFENRPFPEPDLRLLNFYCSNSPEILFTRQRVVNLPTPDGYRAIAGSTLTIVSGAERLERALEGRSELERALEEYFGIRVRLPGAD